MSGTRSTRWYFTDWLSDKELRLCSIAARGLWIDLLCIAGANDGHQHGFVTVAGKPPTCEQLAKLTGGTKEEVERLLAELEENRVFNRTRTGVIYSRRMVRAEKYRANGRLGTPDKPMKTQGNKKAGGTPYSIHKTQKKERKEDSPPTPPEGGTANAGELRLDGGQGSKINADWPKDAFEQFYAAYPKKREREKARRALEAVRSKREIAWERLMAAVHRYAAYARQRGDPHFVKYPAGWLNDGRYDDDMEDEDAQTLSAGARGTPGFAGRYDPNGPQRLGRRSRGEAFVAAMGELSRRMARDGDGGRKDDALPDVGPPAAQRH